MSELRQRRPIVKRRRIQTRRERERERDAQLNFKSEAMRLDDYRCIGATVFASQHTCAGSLQAHHAIRQQTLRAHISTLNLSEPELNDWIWNPDVGITLCEELHRHHTSRKAPIPYEWLPPRVVDYALSRGVGHLLEREHPPFTGMSSGR